MNNHDLMISEMAYQVGLPPCKTIAPIPVDEIDGLECSSVVVFAHEVQTEGSPGEIVFGHGRLVSVHTSDYINKPVAEIVIRLDGGELRLRKTRLMDPDDTLYRSVLEEKKWGQSEGLAYIFQVVPA